MDDHVIRVYLSRDLLKQLDIIINNDMMGTPPDIVKVVVAIQRFASYMLYWEQLPIQVTYEW